MRVEEWFAENLPDQKRPISASSISTGLGCERKFLFTNRWAIRPKVKPYSVGAATGNLVHRLFKAGKEGVEKIHQEVIKEHSKLVERIRAGEDLTGDLTRAANDLNHLYQKALAIVAIFWERFPPKDYMITVSREARIERDCVINTQTKIPVVWIADWIVKDKRNGSIWIRDAKTTGESFASILTGFLYSVQCRFYRLMAEEEGFSPKGFILDMLHTPTIKLCGKDEKGAAKLGCTPFEHYVGRVKEWYETQGEDPMKSEAIIFNEPVMTDELRQALETVYHLQNINPAPSNFSKDITRKGCYNNRKVCPYYLLCSSDEAAWPSLIEQFYEIRGAKEIIE